MRNPLRLIQRVLADERVDSRAVPVKKPENSSLAAQVAHAPALFNRVTRRSVGLYGRFWKWDANTPGMQRTFVPRYLRRHYRSDVPKTRRQRRHRAVILRISARYGL